MSKYKNRTASKNSRIKNNTIRLPNIRIQSRSEGDYWKVLRSCDLLMSNREQ